MNYRHAFHAGNHADVLKHVVLLGVLEALERKQAPFFVLDTHAGRGQYLLQGEQSDRTGEARGGIFRLFVLRGLPPLVQHYLRRVQADNPVGALVNYPGSPLLAAQAMRAQDRLVACELQPDEARALGHLFERDGRVQVLARDGYGAVKALLPPKERRGVVLIDPPYEAQDDEFPRILESLRDGLERNISLVIAKSVILVLNPPWKLDLALAQALPELAKLMGEDGASSRLEWLKREEG